MIYPEHRCEVYSQALMPTAMHVVRGLKEGGYGEYTFARTFLYSSSLTMVGCSLSRRVEENRLKLFFRLVSKPNVLTQFVDRFTGSERGQEGCLTSATPLPMIKERDRKRVRGRKKRCTVRRKQDETSTGN